MTDKKNLSCEDENYLESKDEIINEEIKDSQLDNQKKETIDEISDLTNNSLEEDKNSEENVENRIV